MTVKEMSRLYCLKKLIERDELIIAGETDADGSAMHSVRKRLAKECAEYISERDRLERYISEIDDYLIRLIVAYRFVDLLTWWQIAQRIGGNNTEDSVKKQCYRFFKKQ